MIDENFEKWIRNGKRIVIYLQIVGWDINKWRAQKLMLGNELIPKIALFIVETLIINDNIFLLSSEFYFTARKMGNSVLK